MLITEEATTIETAYLRLHLVPEAKPELQELFRRYLDSRLDTYRRLPNMKAARLEMANSKEIWEENLDQSRSRYPPSQLSSCRRLGIASRTE
jgi:hypothetical protein